MLLQGKKLLITGVLTPQSLAYGVAEHALEQGAEIVLTGFGRARSLTERSAKRLKAGTEVLELDVTNPAHFPALTESLRQRWGRVDGMLHSIAYAPEDALGGNFLNTPWESVQTAFRVSTFSLKELSVAVLPLMTQGGSIVTLDFDNRVAWPIYDWMGVCKAALEATARYLARDLGPRRVRVNLVSAGPLATLAARGIP
ncbi:MAG TPA: enoyl-ACP reductase FabI, partial [Archangium sp.]